MTTETYVCVAGHMKIGEVAEETVIREVKEELGLTVEEVKFIKTYPYEKKERLMLGFLAKVKKADFVCSKEVDSAKWFPFEEALEHIKEGRKKPMVKAIKVMLVPNNVQETKMFRYAGAARFAYNWALLRKKKTMKKVVNLFQILNSEKSLQN